MSGEKPTPLSYIEKGWGQILAIAAGLIFGCGAIFGLIYFLLGLNVTGMDRAIGSVAEKAASDAFQYSVPAVQNIGGGVADQLGTRARNWFEKMKPDSALKLGGITVDWCHWGLCEGQQESIPSADWNIQLTTPGASNLLPLPGQPTSASPQQPTQPVCNKTISNATQQALQYWSEGKWEEIEGILSAKLIPSDECVGSGVIKDYFLPFSTAVNNMKNANNYEQALAMAVEVKRQNPQYRGAYAAETFVNADRVLSVKPLSLSANWPALLSGVQLNSRQTKAEWAAIRRSGDTFELTVDFGWGWTKIYEMSRAEMENLEASLGLKRILTADTGQYGKDGGQHLVAGSVAPSNLPAAPAIDPRVYIPAEPTSTPFQPTVIPTQPPASNQQPPTRQWQQCYFDGTKEIKAYVVQAGMEWGDFDDRNPPRNQHDRNPSNVWMLVVQCP